MPLFANAAEARMPRPGDRIDSTLDVAMYLLNFFGRHQEECVHAFFLNEEQVLCWNETISRGSRTRTQLNFRNLLSIALRLDSAFLILAHNHPSGRLFPSPADITTTQDLKRLCEKVEMRLLDHIIVADGGFLSFASENLL